LFVATAVAAVAAGCADEAVGVTSSTPTLQSSVPTTVPITEAPATSTTPVTTTTMPTPVYAFPFVDHAVSWHDSHLRYPAVDVFGCGAMVVSPTNGIVVQVRDTDPWDPKVDAGSTRGGKYVAVLGADGVRYYFAHLESVQVAVGAAVQPGDPLGPMGQTGDARNSTCHTHMGMSWPCPDPEWQVRRGEVWPQPFLEAWQRGEQLSPADIVAAAREAHPDACGAAAAEPDAAFS
jgi:hypothetical protein